MSEMSPDYWAGYLIGCGLIIYFFYWLAKKVFRRKKKVN